MCKVIQGPGHSLAWFSSFPLLFFPSLAFFLLSCYMHLLLFPPSLLSSPFPSLFSSLALSLPSFLPTALFLECAAAYQREKEGR